MKKIARNQKYDFLMFIRPQQVKRNLESEFYQAIDRVWERAVSSSTVIFKTGRLNSKREINVEVQQALKMKLVLVYPYEPRDRLYLTIEESMFYKELFQQGNVWMENLRLARSPQSLASKILFEQVRSKIFQAAGKFSSSTLELNTFFDHNCVFRSSKSEEDTIIWIKELIQEKFLKDKKLIFVDRDVKSVNVNSKTNLYTYIQNTKIIEYICITREALESEISALKPKALSPEGLEKSLSSPYEEGEGEGDEGLTGHSQLNKKDVEIPINLKKKIRKMTEIYTKYFNRVKLIFHVEQLQYQPGFPMIRDFCKFLIVEEKRLIALGFVLESERRAILFGDPQGIDNNLFISVFPGEGQNENVRSSYDKVKQQVKALSFEQYPKSEEAKKQFEVYLKTLFEGFQNTILALQDFEKNYDVISTVGDRKTHIIESVLNIYKDEKISVDVRLIHVFELLNHFSSSFQDIFVKINFSGVAEIFEIIFSLRHWNDQLRLTVSLQKEQNNTINLFDQNLLKHADHLRAKGYSEMGVQMGLRKKVTQFMKDTALEEPARENPVMRFLYEKRREFENQTQNESKILLFDINYLYCPLFDNSLRERCKKEDFVERFQSNARSQELLYVMNMNFSTELQMVLEKNIEINPTEFFTSSKTNLFGQYVTNIESKAAEALKVMINNPVEYWLAIDRYFSVQKESSEGELVLKVHPKYEISSVELLNVFTCVFGFVYPEIYKIKKANPSIPAFDISTNILSSLYGLVQSSLTLIKFCINETESNSSICN
jgi:hypothetical protein